MTEILKAAAMVNLVETSPAIKGAIPVTEQTQMAQVPVGRQMVL